MYDSTSWLKNCGTSFVMHFNMGVNCEMSKMGLGRGFEGLIPVGLDVADVAAPGEHVKNINIETIVANPDQPRREFDEKALEELAESIKVHGIIQPLVVTPHEDGYRIVAGERRFRASKIAGLKKLPAIIRNHEELEQLEIALVENVQRVDLSPLEQAVSIVRLRDQFSMTPKQIAGKLGKAETTISNIVRLLQLPEQAIEALKAGSISEGHARAILALKPNREQQSALLNTIIEQRLSVREAEDYVKNKKKEQKTQKHSDDDKKITESLRTISKKYGIKAQVKTRKKGGILQISYSSVDELQNVLGTLSR